MADPTLAELIAAGGVVQDAPPAPPQVGAAETFALRGSQALPAGGFLSDLISTAVVEAGKRGLLPGTRDVEGERATLTPEARAELAAMGEQVAEPESAMETYRDIRDTRRERTAAGSEQNPGAARAGTALGIGATVFAPFLPKATVGTGRSGRVLSSALTGAGYGALSGATEGEADLTRGDVAGTLRDTAEGAAMGAALGAGAGAAAEAARPLAGALKRLAVGQAKKTIQGGSDIAAATRKPMSDEAAEEMLRSGVIRPLSTTQATAGRIESLASERGAVYGQILDELEALGVKGPRAKELADQIHRRYLEEFPNYVSSKTIPEIYQRVAANVEEAALPGPPGLVEGPARPNLGLRQTEAIKQDLQNVAKYERLQANPSNEAYRELASTVRQANEEAIAAAGAAAPRGSRLQEVAASFEPVKAQLARTLEARHFARPGSSKAEQRSAVGLKDYLIGASTGDPGAAVGTALLSSVARNRAPSTLASGAYGLSEGLRTGSLAGDVAAGLAGGAELTADELQSRADRATIDQRTDPITAAIIRALRTKPKSDKKEKR